MMTKREFMENVIANTQDAEMIEFAQASIEKMDNANANRKPTAKQRENEGFKAEILEVLKSASQAMSIADIKATVPSLADASSQKVSAMLTALKKEGKIVRVDLEKRKAGFAIAE